MLISPNYVMQRMVSTHAVYTISYCERTMRRGKRDNGGHRSLVHSKVTRYRMEQENRYFQDAFSFDGDLLCFCAAGENDTVSSWVRHTVR